MLSSADEKITRVDFPNVAATSENQLHEVTRGANALTDHRDQWNDGKMQAVTVDGKHWAVTLLLDQTRASHMVTEYGRRIRACHFSPELELAPSTERPHVGDPLARSDSPACEAVFEYHS